MVSQPDPSFNIIMCTENFVVDNLIQKRRVLLSELLIRLHETRYDVLRAVVCGVWRETIYIVSDCIVGFSSVQRTTKCM